MKFWLHKINPGQNNETNCFNILKLNLLATGYSDMAKSFIYNPGNKLHDNEIYICQIISDKVINVQNGEIPQIASDIGFLHLIKFIRKMKFTEADKKLQNFIEENKRINTTIEIDDLDIIETI